MARLLAPACALCVLCVVPAASAGAASNDTSFFCRVSCAGNLTSSCRTGECLSPPKGCDLLAVQPFADDEVCSEFLKSEPVCDGATRQCAEAANFQLVHGRGEDFRRSYRLREWVAAAHTFAHDGVAFIPGGARFLMGRKEIAAAVEAFHDSSKLAGVAPTVAQVLTLQGQGAAGQVVHATGTWAPEQASSQNQEGARYYARWIEVANAHWVMDTFVLAPPAAVSSVMANLLATSGAADDRSKWTAHDPTFAAIQARQSRFASLYNSKNYSGLVAEMYAEGSAILPGDDGKLVPRAAAEAYFRGMPLGLQAKAYPTIVAQSPDGRVAHEVGFSGSTMSGYYARWARANEGKEWVLEAHCFGVFPKADVGLQLVV